MRPEDAAAWYPVIRDFGLLIAGGACIVLGLLQSNAGLASLGFGVGAVGAVGRAASPGFKRNGDQGS